MDVSCQVGMSAMIFRAGDPPQPIQWYRVPKGRPVLPIPHRFGSWGNIDWRHPQDPAEGSTGECATQWKGAYSPVIMWAKTGDHFCGSPQAWLNGAGPDDPDLNWTPWGFSTCCEGVVAVATPNAILKAGTDGLTAADSRLTDSGAGCIESSTCINATDFEIGGVSIQTMFATPAFVLGSISGSLAGYLTAADAASTYLTILSAVANFQPLDGDLSSLASLGGSGVIPYRVGTDNWGTVTIGSGLSFVGGTLSASGAGGTVTSVGITPPSEGITVSGSPVTSAGNITLALANDLAALEALTGSDVIPYRSGTDAWGTVTFGSGVSFSGGTITATGTGGTVTSVNITAPAAGITASGGPVTGSGAITLALANDLAALEALTGSNVIPYRSGTDAWGTVTIGSNLSFTAGTLSATVPTEVVSGTIVAYGGSSVPTGFLECDGSAVSRTTYAALFTAIGTTWGAGDGSTTFNVPDFRGRVLMGDGTGSGLTARTLGQTLGAETWTLLSTETPKV